MQIKRLILLSVVALHLTTIYAIAQSTQTEGLKLGTWELLGKDKREWKAVLALTNRDGTTYEGYFKWQALNGEPSSGHEPFRGIFNPLTGIITFKGLEMHNKKGNIATGSIYEATVSEGGYRLRDGKWFGQNVLPGTWSAVWKSSETPKP